MLRLAILLLPLFLLSAGEASAYEKATEGQDVVLNKLFPKKSKVELDAKFGVVLNSSYQQTFMANGSMTYFFSEEWGFNLDGNYAIVTDKPERTCIETFYNDPNFNVPEECGEDAPEDSEEDANWGPAYVPIRTLKYIFTANMNWNPIYGKQIVLLSATNYFDFFLTFGGGVAMSDYYAKTPEFADTGTPTRGTFCVKKDAAAGTCEANKNPGTAEKELTGIEGRPVPESQTNVLIHLALGQRFHFLKRFLLTAGLDNYTLVGTESGIDNFFTLTGGLGVRF